MGIVFQASRSPDGEVVALKVLRQSLSEDELYRRRFEREARIASELRHKHVVPVLDFGESSGRLFLVTPYIRGSSLSERIAIRGPLSLPDTMRVAAELSRALDALHAGDLVHRDVKPGNVLLDEDGSAALTDFGLARGAADTVLTKAGTVVGTVDYLAPELIQGERASAASDIYAFGCLLYECLAGDPPFAGRAFVETLVAHTADDPVDLTMRRPDLPPEVSWTISTALAKDPAQRPATAVAFARVLRASAQTS
jgi:serine/threonine-protein kinase